VTESDFDEFKKHRLNHTHHDVSADKHLHKPSNEMSYKENIEFFCEISEISVGIARSVDIAVFREILISIQK